MIEFLIYLLGSREGGWVRFTEVGYVERLCRRCGW